MQHGFPLIKLVEGGNGKNNFLFVNTKILQDYIDKWKIQKLNN